MATPMVTKSLEDVVRLELGVKAVISDIQACSGPPSALQSFNAEARKKIQEIKKILGELETFAKERDSEDEKEQLVREIESQRRQLECNLWISGFAISLVKGTISSLRRSNLQCQLRIDHGARDGLLASSSADPSSSEGPRHRSAGEAPERKAVNKERLVNSVSDVTDSMMELSRKLTVQVEHSSATVETLMASSKTIQESHEEVKGMDAHINTSNKLLNKYWQRQLTDHIIVFLGLVFFYSTVLYIVKKRLWPGDSGPDVETGP